MAESCCSQKKDGLAAASDFSNWMADLPAELTTQPLSSLAIPGSHDSFSFGMDAKGDLAPNCPPFIVDLCRVFGGAAKRILYNWSLTQDLSLTDQLKAGIRYFDFRVAYKANSDDFFLCHALYAQTVLDACKDINDYLSDHPKEVVLLDLNHFYDMTVDLHKRLLEGLQNVFGDKLCPLLDCGGTTLSLLWENKLQILIFYHDDLVKDYLQFWPGEMIPSPWPNTYSTTKLIKYLEANYQQGRPKDTFYVTQGILTPDSSYVFKHIMGNLRKTLCYKAAATYVPWVMSKERGLQKLNICLLDFVQLADYSAAVIQLNYKT